MIIMFGDAYMVEVNFMFRQEEIVDRFWEIFMVLELEKVNEVHVKIELSQYILKSFQDDIHNLVVIKCVVFLVGYQVVLFLIRMV
jgi:hypothetical protein